MTSKDLKPICNAAFTRAARQDVYAGTDARIAFGQAAARDIRAVPAGLTAKAETYAM